MNFPRRLFESERGGGNAGRLLFAVAFFDGVFGCVNQLAHGERLLARVQYRDFRIDAEARVAALARYRAGKAQYPFTARLAGNPLPCHRIPACRRVAVPLPVCP